MSEISFPKLGLSFNISRVAFTIGPVEIYWYGILITVGLILAVTYAIKRAKSFGIDPDRLIDATIGGVVGAFIGARLYYVIFSWSDYSGNFLKMINVRDGGLAIYGGLIGGLLVGCIVAKVRKLRIPPLLDVVSLGFLIGQALGRWGNFFNQEAFGSNTNLPWGMTGPGIQNYLSAHAMELRAQGITVTPTDPVHPCFLYESLWCVLGFVLLHFYSKKHRKFDGEVFLMYVAWYGVGRAFIEGLRTDSLTVGYLRTSQVLAIISALAAIVAMIIIRSKIKRAGDYVFYVDTDESKELIAQYEAAQIASKNKSDVPESADTDESADMDAPDDLDTSDETDIPDDTDAPGEAAVPDETDASADMDTDVSGEPAGTDAAPDAPDGESGGASGEDNNG